jgi:hypothetical protein
MNHFETKNLFREIVSKYSSVFFALLFLFSYLGIVSQIIVLPFDNEKLIHRDGLKKNWEDSNNPQWKGGCKKYTEVKEYQKSLTDEEKGKLKDVCFLKVSLKDNRFLGKALQLDESILLRQICTDEGSMGFVSEREYDRKEGSTEEMPSVWDLRKFGTESEDGRCLILDKEIATESYLPILFFQEIEDNNVTKSLVYGNKALVAVYLFSFIFNVLVWKSIAEAFSMYSKIKQRFSEIL